MLEKKNLPADRDDASPPHGSNDPAKRGPPHRPDDPAPAAVAVPAVTVKVEPTIAPVDNLPKGDTSQPAAAVEPTHHVGQPVDPAGKPIEPVVNPHWRVSHGEKTAVIQAANANEAWALWCDGEQRWPGPKSGKVELVTTEDLKVAKEDARTKVADDVAARAATAAGKPVDKPSNPKK